MRNEAHGCASLADVGLLLRVFHRVPLCVGSTGRPCGADRRRRASVQLIKPHVCAYTTENLSTGLRDWVRMGYRPAAVRIGFDRFSIRGPANITPHLYTKVAIPGTIWFGDSVHGSTSLVLSMPRNALRTRPMCCRFPPHLSKRGSALASASLAVGGIYRARWMHRQARPGLRWAT